MKSFFESNYLPPEQIDSPADQHSNGSLNDSANPNSPAAQVKQPNRPKTLRTTVLLLLIGVSIGLSVQYGRKASKGRSAFVRWRPILQSMYQGEDLYAHPFNYPNPPIMAILLQPLSLLPTVPGALIWFYTKLFLTALSFYWTLQLIRENARPLSIWAELLLISLSLRPIISDLQHGNVNLFILFLIVAGLKALQSKCHRTCGLLIALAASCKVTPVLFCLYFIYKGAWRVATWSVLGLVLFLILIPSCLLGFEANNQLLEGWTELMILPYLLEGQVEVEQTNQSLAGVLSRLLINVPSIAFKGAPTESINLVSLEKETVQWLIRATGIVFVCLLAISCHTCTQSTNRWLLACEYSLVLMCMLFLSERSWKHHYVTMLIPYAVVCHGITSNFLSLGWRRYLGSILAISMLLMASTSQELGELAFGSNGHKYAQGYGAFFMSGLIVFISIFALLFKHRRSDLKTNSPN